ncbi:hypothetical protein GCM10017690_14850 [Microbacterium terregens]
MDRDETEPSPTEGGFIATRIDDLPTFAVAPGITGRTLPATDLIRAWAYDFAPGTRWPTTDRHVFEERYYVASGEIDDNGTSYPAGTYVVFSPGTSHRPGSRSGGRMIGMSDARDPGDVDAEWRRPERGSALSSPVIPQGVD